MAGEDRSDENPLGSLDAAPLTAGTSCQEPCSHTDILPRRAQGLAGSVTSDSASLCGNIICALGLQPRGEIWPADVFCLACTMFEKFQSQLPIIAKDCELSYFWPFLPTKSRLLKTPGAHFFHPGCCVKPRDTVTLSPLDGMFSCLPNPIT